MLVVDSGVWIDFFNDAKHPAVDVLAALLHRGEVQIVVPDLVLFEVLRGFRSERAHRSARLLMTSLHLASTGGASLALVAAEHYRGLRSQGFTVRSSVDVLVAAFCIEHDHALLHHDRDFDAFERLRGLRVWPAEPTERSH